jgi:hypothetical protein
MTARKRLRDIADRLHVDKPHVCDVLCAEDAERANALRTLADRIDEAEAVAKQRSAADMGFDWSRREEYQLALLRRLDADLDHAGDAR